MGAGRCRLGGSITTTMGGLISSSFGTLRGIPGRSSGAAPPRFRLTVTRGSMRRYRMLCFITRVGGGFGMCPSSRGSLLTRVKGWGWRSADYDHDGRMDVFVTNDTVPNLLFHNLSGGR